MLLQMQVQGITIDDPFHLHQNHISDHALVFISISEKSRLPPTMRPIPQYIFQNPAYRHHLEGLVQVALVDRLSVPLRIMKLKDMMRESARISRNDLLV